MPEPTPRVAIGYVHRDEQATSFIDCLADLIAHDRAHLGLLAHEHSRISVRVGTDGLVAARNTVAEQFVASRADWLLWIDTDMGFTADTMYKLVAVADPAERPVVGALCFASRQYAHDGMHGYRTRPQPTIFDWLVGDDGKPRFASVPMYPVNQLVQVAGTGAACILIHRSVFERLAEKFGPTWYDRTPGTDGKLLGEDISFCVRCSALEIPLHVYTGVRTTHFKTQWVSETDHWMRYVPPAAAEPAAVLVSGAQTDEFAVTLRASTGLTTVRGSLDEATEPWVVLANGDEKWRPGWLDHAQHVAESFGVPVVGINNPFDEACVAGVSATTLLVRRGYLEGAHAVDVPSARERGEFAMALGAVAERDSTRPAVRVPRYAIIPTHNRPELLTSLVASLGRQCDRIVVLDNASEPPVDEEQLQAAAGVPILVLRDEEQPPHLSRYWNVMLDAVADWADTDVYDVAILNDDSVMPAGWYDACATALREHETAVIAHTTPTTPALLTELHNRPDNRMTPHAFVIRGEPGHRADESMRWWYFDTDLDLRARQAGGVLSVQGPRVVNSRANSTTVGLLAGQAQADHGAFAAKWSR